MAKIKLFNFNYTITTLLNNSNSYYNSNRINGLYINKFNSSALLNSSNDLELHNRINKLREDNINSKLTNFLRFIDFIITTLLFTYIIYSIFIALISFTDNFYQYTNSDIICSVTDSSKSTNSTTTIHGDSGWSGSIRQIFIYGTGALRLHLLRGGTPLTRTFVLGSSVAADAFSRGIVNAINDPKYVEKHIDSWRRILDGRNKSRVQIHVDEDPDTLQKVEEATKTAEEVTNTASKLISDDNGLDNWISTLFNKILEILKPILEPVHVDYSNEVLASQINGISILLFILSVLIIILLIAFILNILILVYSNKLIELFTNKYIKWYINFNKKIIGIEICFLGASLLYFMYILSYGIHFICTHPIIIN